MQNIKTFTGNNEVEIWNQIAADLSSGNEVLDYQAKISYGGYDINVVVDIDLGGGFEGGFEMTVFSAMLLNTSDYKFAIHNEDFLDEIGKFFGMQDVELGYPEFDKKVIVKTNNHDRTSKLFDNQAFRTFLNGLGAPFNIGITESHGQHKLEMTVEKGFTDVTTLQKMYGYFYGLLTQIDQPE